MRSHLGNLHGWHSDLGEESRHEALERSVRADGYATTARRLNLLINVGNRRNDERTRRIAREDAHWLRRRYRSNRRSPHWRSY